MRVEVAKPQELGAPERELWARFRSENPELANPYFAPGWSDVIAHQRGDARVAVISEAEEIVAFLPYQHASRVTLLPMGGALSDYQGFICRESAEIDADEAVAQIGAGRFDFTHALMSQKAFAEAQRAVSSSWIACLGEGFDAYAAAKRAAGSSVLKRIRSKRRRMERALGELRFTACSTDQADLDTLITWKRKQFERTNRPDVFAESWTRAVVTESFHAEDADYQGVLFTLHAGDRLAAANFCLRSNHVLHCWFIAHDDEFHDQSPGLVLFGDILQSMEGLGAKQLDLGAGDYRFKAELATRAREVGSGFVGKPGLSTSLRSMQYAIRDTFERLPLGRVSAWPGKAMRRFDLMRGLAEHRGDSR